MQSSQMALIDEGEEPAAQALVELSTIDDYFRRLAAAIVLAAMSDARGSSGPRQETEARAWLVTDYARQLALAAGLPASVWPPTEENIARSSRRLLANEASMNLASRNGGDWLTGLSLVSRRNERRKAARKSTQQAASEAVQP